MLRRIARAYATPARRAPPHTRTCAWRRRRQHTLHVYIHRRRVRFRDPGPRACPSSRVQRRGRLVRRVCGRVSRDSAVRREMRRSCDRDRERTRRHVHRGQRFSARYAHQPSRPSLRCAVRIRRSLSDVSRSMSRMLLPNRATQLCLSLRVPAASLGAAPSKRTERPSWSDDASVHARVLSREGEHPDVPVDAHVPQAVRHRPLLRGKRAHRHSAHSQHRTVGIHRMHAAVGLLC